MRDPRRDRKKSKRSVLWISFVCFCLLVFMLRHVLLAVGVDLAFRYFLSKESYRHLAYEQLEWREGISISGLQLHEEGYSLLIDQVEVRSLFKPHLLLTHPELVLRKGGHSDSAPPALGLPLFVKMDIANGVLQLEDTEVRRFYFSLQSHQDEKKGTFSLSYDPSPLTPPMLLADLEIKGKDLATTLQIQEVECKKLFDLVRFFAPGLSSEWAKMEGEMELSGTAFWSGQLHLKSLSCLTEMRNLSFPQNPLGMQLQAQHVCGEIAYEEGGALQAALALDGGELLCSSGQEEWGVKELQGELRIEPEQDPTLLLKGMVHHLGKQSALELSGKGSLYADATFWSELKLTLASVGQRVASASVSLCSNEKQSYLLQADVQQWGRDQMAIVQQLLGQSSLGEIEGSLQGKVSASIEKGALKKVEVEGLCAEGLFFHAPKDAFQAGAKTLIASATLTQSAEGWKVEHLIADLDGGDLKGAPWVFNDLAGHLEIVEGNWGVSALTGRFLGIEGRILSQGEEKGGDIELTLSSTAGHLLHLFSTQESNSKLPLELHSIFKKQGQGYTAAGTLQIAEQKVSFDFDLQGLEISHGQFTSEKLRPDVYRPFVQWIDPSFDLEGDLDFSGHFDSKSFFCGLRGAGVVFHHPLFDLQVEEIGKDGTAFFSYDIAKGHWRGEVPLIHAECRERQQGILLEDLQASVTLLGEKSGWRLETIVKDFACSISPQAVFRAGSAEMRFDATKEEFFLTHLGGELVCDSGNTYHLDAGPLLMTPLEWQFDIALKNRDIEVFRVAGFAGAKKGEEREISFDSQLTHFYGASLDISRFTLRGGKIWNLEMRPLIVGKKFTTQMGFLSEIGLISSQLQALNLEGGVQTHLIYEQSQQRLTFEAEGKQLHLQDAPIEKLLFRGEKAGKQWLVEKLQMDEILATACFTQEGELLNFSLFEVEKEGQLLRGNGVYDLAKAEGEVNLVLDLPALSLQLCSEGKIPVSYASSTLEMRKMALVAIDRKSKQPEGHCAVDAFCYDLKESQGAVSGARFSCSPKLLPSAASLGLKKDLGGKAEASWDKKGFLIQGALDDGNYSLVDKEWLLRQVAFRYDGKMLFLKAATAHQEVPLLAHLQVDCSAQPLGVVTLRDVEKSPGMQLFFKMSNGAASWEKVRGSFCGLDADLVKSAGKGLNFTGSLKVDAEQLAPLLPKETQESLKKLKLGKGYSLTGTLRLTPEASLPIDFKGELKGEQFTLLGYVFDAMEASAEIGGEQLLLRNISLTDAAGNLSIKQIKVAKGADAAWSLDVPLARVQEFRPSLLRKSDGSSQPSKPLLIKNLSFFDLKGNLADLSSLSAKGAFHFTNAFKKEESLFDAPLEMLKNLGLDLGILTPVHGEIEYELRGDKCYVTALKEMYSEGKRSEFYLPFDEESYLDLNGNLNINLKMKQNVLLKVTEAFTLSVRGTLEKPKYSLR